MMELVSKEEGRITDNGDFIPAIDVTGNRPSDGGSSSATVEEISGNSSVEQVINLQPNLVDDLFSIPFVHDWSWNLFSGFDILFGAPGTLVMGILGILVNMRTWVTYNPSNIEITPKQYLTQGLLDEPTILEIYLDAVLGNLIDNPVIQSAILEIEGSISDFGDTLTVLTSCFFVGLGILKALSTLSGFDLIIEIISLIVSIYLPDMITGVIMVFSSISHHSDTQANVGWFLSNYEVLGI